MALYGAKCQSQVGSWLVIRQVSGTQQLLFCSVCRSGGRAAARAAACCRNTNRESDNMPPAVLLFFVGTRQQIFNIFLRLHSCVTTRDWVCQRVVEPMVEPSGPTDVSVALRRLLPEHCRLFIAPHPTRELRSHDTNFTIEEREQLTDS